MSNLKKKLNGSEGFTLVEMLIVVAIIAILIAISIPMVQSALEKAKHATDAANERSAKAAILVQVLDGSKDADTPYFYNATEGTLDTAAPSAGYGKHGTHNGGVIAISADTSGKVAMQWVTSSGSPAAFTLPDSIVDAATLCTKNVSHTP